MLSTCSPSAATMHSCTILSVLGLCMHCAHALQACSGIEENGVADEATWRALLGDRMQPVAPPIDVSPAHAAD